MCHAQGNDHAESKQEKAEKQEKNGKLRDVPVTEAKRKRIRTARPYRGVRRIARRHATATPDSLAFLQIRHFDADEERPRLTQQDAHEDLDQLEWLVENTHSYRDLRAFDHRAAFDAVRNGVDTKGIARDDFHLQLRKLVALFGDGHGTVPGLFKIIPKAGLPFRLRPVRGGVLAIRWDGTPYDLKFPYVRSIDNTPIAEWMAAAARVAPRGSIAAERVAGYFFGCFATFTRTELGLRGGGPLEIELRAKSGRRRRLTLPLNEIARPWNSKPPSGARELQGSIGYVAIPSMSLDDREVTKLIEQVEAYEDAKGLILDIRGNLGGQREVLRRLMPHLMARDAKPTVVNVAAVRLAPGMDEDDATRALARRHLHLPSWRGFSKAEAAAAKTTLAGFRPDWALPRREFGAWHAMVVSPAPRDAWRMTRRIAVLIDGYTFSAADVFAGALERLPHVTLVGTSTGGGSGRTLEHILRNSGLQVELSSMASFRADGKRYDGLGVAAGLEVEATLEDVLAGRDPVLEAALKHLTR